MPRPITAYIHPEAIRHNLNIVRQKTSGSRVWAVVKANAYGHGIERIYPALDAADGIALLDIDEAVRVRELGWKKPILLLEGIFKQNDVKTAEVFGLTAAVHCDEQLELIAAAHPARRIDINLKMNSGMNRLGYTPDEFGRAWQRARASDGVGAITLMSHLLTLTRAKSTGR
jgi:alanine racemase